MKNRKYALMITVFALVMSTQTAVAADGTGTATATIIAPITITPVLDLAFGKLSANTGGTVVISTAGARSVGSGTVALVNTGSTQNQATFDITGDGVSTYAITLPGAAATITSGGDTMSVDTFVSDPAATGTLTAGAQTVNVGGTLTVGSGQATGSYTGTFTVTVEYN